MSILADSPRPRMFKATRRMLVTEITLIVVIVATLSYGIFALYKLAVGSDPLFGYSSSLSPHASQQAANSTHHQQTTAFKLHETSQDRFQTRPPLAQMSQGELRQQLAEYKSLILKELLAREQRLLGSNADPSRRRAPDSHLLLPLEPRQAQSRTPGAVDFNELRHWNGGYKLPSSLDYLFDQRSKSNLNPQTLAGGRHERLPSSSVTNHAAVSLSPESRLGSGAGLIQLKDAPSLMQLNPAVDPSSSSSGGGDEDNEDYEQAATTTMGPSDRFLGGQFQESQAQDSANLSGPPDEQDERRQQQQVSVTTTEAPLESETTTLEPSGGDGEESALADGPQEDNGRGGSRSDRQGTSGGLTRDEPDESDRLRTTSNSIDDEVDRMTQPSLGRASQQDRPEVARNTDLKATVQFDDQPQVSTRRSSSVDEEPSPPRGHGDVPSNNQAGKLGILDLLHKMPDRNRRGERDSSADLLVAENLHNSPISTLGEISSVPHAGHSNSLKISSRGLADQHRDSETSRAGVRRTRRSARVDQLVASGKKATQKGGSGTSQARRSDDGDDEDEEPDSGHDDRESAQAAHQAQGQPSKSRLVASNDPTLQELLAHKQLLDALQQSQVPSPVGEASQPALNHRAPGGLTGSKKHPQDDREPADTHYSVDHGLLLYPVSDDDHQHSSMAHSGGKSSKKKAKKKQTVAMKKGGHKSNKHKKEEKKYIKEKKFKGSKKGKKEKEGKGGKGAKKGIKKYRDKGYKKKGFKNTYVKNEFGQKKSYFDEFRDKDYKKKWKNFNDKYKYANMKKWQAKDMKGAKKMKEHGEKFKQYDKSKWKKKMSKHHESESEKKKKKKKSEEFRA